MLDSIGKLVICIDIFDNFDNYDILVQMERMIGSIGKLGTKVDLEERQMERMIGSLGKLGRKVDIGRKMNDPDGALDPWSCFFPRASRTCPRPVYNKDQTPDFAWKFVWTVPINYAK